MMMTMRPATLCHRAVMPCGLSLFSASHSRKSWSANTPSPRRRRRGGPPRHAFCSNIDPVGHTRFVHSVRLAKFMDLDRDLHEKKAAYRWLVGKYTKQFGQDACRRRIGGLWRERVEKNHDRKKGLGHCGNVEHLVRLRARRAERAFGTNPMHPRRVDDRPPSASTQKAGQVNGEWQGLAVADHVVTMSNRRTIKFIRSAFVVFQFIRSRVGSPRSAGNLFPKWAAKSPPPP
jgi:hypothetical protein